MRYFDHKNLTMRTPILNKHNLIFRLVIVFLIGVWGCSKNSEPDDEGQRCQVKAKDGQDDDIIGEWKLVKGQTVFHEPKTIDYSCDNIIYKFQENGTLVVSSDTETLIDLETGQYSYQLRHEPLESSNEEFTLQIEESFIGSEISADTMILNHSYLDGPILHFVRIK